jgi:hypothetical protein
MAAHLSSDGGELLMPWQCPSCKVWNAPHVTQHRCDDGFAAGGVVIIPGPRPTPLGCWRCGVCQCDVLIGTAHLCGGYVWPTTIGIGSESGNGAIVGGVTYQFNGSELVTDTAAHTA